MNHLPCMLPCTLRAYRYLQYSPTLSCCSNHHPLYHLPGLPHPHRCYLPRLSLLLHQLAQSPGVSYLQQSPSWSPGQRHYRPHHSHCSSPCNCPPSKCPPRLSPPSTPSNLHRNRPPHPLRHHCSLFPPQPSQPHPHSMWSLVPSYLPPSPPDSPQPPRSLMNHLPCMLPCNLRAYRYLQYSIPLSCCSNRRPHCLPHSRLYQSNLTHAQWSRWHLPVKSVMADRCQSELLSQLELAQTSVTP